MDEKIEELLKKTFLKLRSDYGFKRAFASEEHKEALKKFLNALLEGKMEITGVTFQNKEILPPDKNGKRIYYDASVWYSTYRRVSSVRGKKVSPTGSIRCI